jgi:hypothetical protein
MDQIRIAKKNFDSKTESRRNADMSTIKCLEDVQNDSRVLEVKRWWQKTNNRVKYASFMKLGVAKLRNK